MIPGKYPAILKELVLASLDAPSGIDAVKFRAAHEDDFDALDELECSQYIERKDQRYVVSLLAFSEFKECDQRIGSMLHLCSHIFSSLRVFYKEFAGESMALDELVKRVDLPERQVRKGLEYLTQAPIWGGYTTDIMNSSEVTITPGERILKYKTFNDVLAQLSKWAEKPSFGDAALSVRDDGISTVINQTCDFGKGDKFTLPDWHENLPDTIKLLMEEIYIGLKNNMCALPSMGLRSVIDEVCNDTIGDIGGFKKKLAVLEKEHITAKNKKILEDVLEIGHASIHRGYSPPNEDIKDALAVVVHLLNEVYILREKSSRIRDKVPVRAKHT